MLSLQILPPEIHRHVKEYLDIKSRLRLEQTCKFLRQLVLQSVLKRRLNLNSYRISNNQLERYISKIGHPQLLYWGLWISPLINGDSVPRLDYIFHSLTELNLSFISINDNNVSVLWELSSRHNILKELIFMNCDTITDGLAN